MTHKPFIFSTFLASLVATVFLFMVIPQDFLPANDSGALFGFTRGANGTSIADAPNACRCAAVNRRAIGTTSHPARINQRATASPIKPEAPSTAIVVVWTTSVPRVTTAPIHRKDGDP